MIILLREQEIVLNAITYLKELGCAVVRTEVESPKNKRRRADLVGYVVSEDNQLIPQIVVEVKAQLSPQAIQQLFTMAQEFEVPYALVVTNETKQFYDGKTLFPVSEPVFHSQRSYKTDPREIEITFSKIMDLFRQYGYTPYEYPILLGSGLIVRIWLDRQGQLDKWRKIGSVWEYQQYLKEAFTFFGIEYENMLDFHDLGQVLDPFLALLDQIPPEIEPDILMNNFFRIIQSASGKWAGIYIPSIPIRKLFRKITEALSIKGKKAIDLSMGYGYLLHELSEVVEVDLWKGIEVNQATSMIAKMVNLLSGTKNVEIISYDPLWIDQHNPEERNTYCLAATIPPFGVSIEKSASNNDLEKFEVARPTTRKKVESVELFIEQSINIVQPGGYILILVPEGILFSTQSRITRELIKTKTIIEGIISLPSHALKPYTAVKTSLLILRKKTNANETATELFMSKPESVDDFEETIQAFTSWKKGGTIS